MRPRRARAWLGWFRWWPTLLLIPCLVAACAPRNRPAPQPADDKTTDATQPGDPKAPTASEAVILLQGGRVMTATGVIYERGDVLIVGERIAEVGPRIAPPKGAEVIDVSGNTVTPGLVDTHSHIGVYPAPHLSAHSDGNEIVGPNTAYVRSSDGYWPQDPQIERARAGGVTTMQILPGSANLIGGRSFTVKTYPDAISAEEARFEGAPYGLKIACGENPKRVYGEKGGPYTRMGNIAGFRNAFQDAREYRRKQQRYALKMRSKTRGKKKKKKKRDDDDDDDGPPEPPDRDFGLETLASVLDGTILVHNHCYRADEMLIMLALAEEFGFKIRSFHHAVEAYKIADELAAAGTAASVWADWWGFKAEAYDGIRENAAMVASAGGRAIIHSDSAEGIQRLNQEAAKALFAGRRAGLSLSEDEALRWITANPAWALGVHERVGTLEAGKQADIVVWNGTPFSVYAKAQRVFIEGHQVFDAATPSPPQSDFELGQSIPAATEVTR